MPSLGTNWAGNHTYRAAGLARPTSLDELSALVARSSRVRALGSRHSFSDLTDTQGLLVDLAGLDPGIRVDPGSATVSVGGGVRYGHLAPVLEGQGWALANLASLPHISVAGSISTGTHGSGETNGSLASAVSAIELVSAAGGFERLSRATDGETFRGAVVGLGALGVITRITLDLQPAYMMRQHVYENMPLAELTEHFDAIQASGYSVSLFWDWQEARINAVWIKARVDAATPFDAPARFHGATRAAQNLHPIPGLSAEHCTEQLGAVGPWHERLPHFRMGFMPSAGRELQSEYFVPRQNAVDAILAVETLKDQIGPHLLVTEIRTIAADDLWMSPACGQDSVAIHFTWKPDLDAVSQLMPRIERALAPYRARPHWGKLFTMTPTTLRAVYPHLPAFVALARRHDPQGKFRNAFLNEHIFTT